MWLERGAEVTRKLTNFSDAAKDFWSVTVRANRRIIFRFEDGDVDDVDLLDYH